MSAHGCFKACPEERYCAASAATIEGINYNVVRNELRTLQDGFQLGDQVVDVLDTD